MYDESSRRTPLNDKWRKSWQVNKFWVSPTVQLLLSFNFGFIKKDQLEKKYGKKTKTLVQRWPEHTLGSYGGYWTDGFTNGCMDWASCVMDRFGSELRGLVRWYKEVLTSVMKASAHLSFIMFAPCCGPRGDRAREPPQLTQWKCVLETFLMEECGS